MAQYVFTPPLAAIDRLPDLLPVRERFPDKADHIAARSMLVHARDFLATSMHDSKRPDPTNKMRYLRCEFICHAVERTGNDYGLQARVCEYIVDCLKADFPVCSTFRQWVKLECPQADNGSRSAFDQIQQARHRWLNIMINHFHKELL
jgi:hypothetical protein